MVNNDDISYTVYPIEKHELVVHCWKMKNIYPIETSENQLGTYIPNYMETMEKCSRPPTSCITQLFHNLRCDVRPIFSLQGLSYFPGQSTRCSEGDYPVLVDSVNEKNKPSDLLQ
jgi:hypothetical protein